MRVHDVRPFWAVDSDRPPSKVAVAAIAVAGLAWAVAAELYSLHDFGVARAVVDGITGLAFMAAGLVAWVRRPGYVIGPLLIAAGFGWFVGGNPQTTTTDAPIYTFGLLTTFVFGALLVHIIATFPSGRATERFDRMLVAAAYVVLAGIGPIPFLFFDPRRHECPECEEGLNLIAVEPDPGLYDTTSSVVALLVGLVVTALVIRVARRFKLASPSARRVLRPVVIYGSIGLIILGVGPFLLGAQAHGDDEADRIQGFTRDAAAGLLPIGLLTGVLRTRAGRSPVGRLLMDLNEAPGQRDLRGVLADALGDPSLELGLWVPALARYVDPSGTELLPRESAERCVTHVEGEAGRLAVLVHDRVLLEDEDLVRSVTGVARLELERERLQADVRAQLEEVRASRARIVEAGDSERRRIERNLHDGAQQRLLALTFGLRMLEERLNGNRDEEVRGLLAELQHEAGATLDELRELARGIHPQVLTDEGLGAALEVLAARVPVAVRLVSAPTTRVPAPVEAAAYYVCAEALANVAKHARANEATVEARAQDGLLVVEVADDGRGGADACAGTGLRGLADRVAALGGTLDIAARPAGGTSVRACIPYATRAAAPAPAESDSSHAAQSGEGLAT